MHRPRVLLLGNGINRAYKFASWDEMLSSIKKRDFSDEEQVTLQNIPYPLQSVIMTGDHVDTQMATISEQLTELMPPAEEQELLKQYARLPVDAILTTNYTYEIEKSLVKSFSCKVGCKSKYRKRDKTDAGKYELSQLYTYFQPLETAPSIWHIHGEAAKHQTMVIGHYYYGKLIAKIQQHIADHMALYKLYLLGKTDFSPFSWIDYFMLGDIYIVGLGMDVSEMDLWWLVNCKKLHFPITKVFLFKPDIKPTERMLAEAYNVNVVDAGLSENDYPLYYQWVMEQLALLVDKC